MKEIPRLVILDMYRNAIKTVEKVSRQRGHKKVHAWAIKEQKAVTDMIMQVSEDEMDGIEEEEEEAKKRAEIEEFYR